jgi:hypothetical protein
MGWLNTLRAARLRRVSPWRAALADLPVGLESYWRGSAPREYEGIRTDAFFFVRAAEGLLRFFDAVGQSGQSCALPSEAADSVWHAWLRWNPISLENFCRRHFGTAVPHADRTALDGGALLHTFTACCARDGVKPGTTRLPALFGLDAALRMPGGHGYWNRAGEIRYARLNERGRGMWRARPHPELALTALYAAGLVDLHILAAHQRRREATPDGSSCGGMAFADGGACSDGAGSDGGCDGGGSSCGSSCGSGCGGGGD